MSTAASRSVAVAERLTLALLIVGIALLLTHTDWLWRLDRVFYDAQLRLWQRPPPDDIVIVAIDESSLRRLGRWPWSRAVHADLVQRLQAENPKAIAFDVIFAEPDLDRPADDARLVAAIADSGQVALPVLMEQPRRDGQPIETLPFPALANVAAALGHVHIELDPDSIGRSLYLYEGLGSPHWPHLSLAMLRIGGEQAGIQLAPSAPATAADSPLVWIRSNPQLIPFSGPPGHIRRLSYHQVLNGDFSPGTFRDKYVLVGTTAVGLGDALPTPFSGFSHSMSGVEINANILDALRRGLTISPLGKNAALLLGALLALMPVLVFPKHGPRNNLLMTAVLLILTIATSTSLLFILHIWFPPTPALLAITLSYPLWSWRRLELTMRYLGEELDEMHNQQAQLSRGGRITPAETHAFIGSLLPVNGWSLSDEQQQLLEQWGDAPDPPGNGDFDHQWLRDGDCYWKRIDSPRGAALLGVRWTGNEPPSTSELQLLSDFIQPAALHRPLTSDSAAKDVQSRIVQVQQATTQLHSLRRFIDDSLANMADGVIVADLRGEVILANTRAAWYLRGDDDRNLTGEPLLSLLEDVLLDQGGQWRDLLRTAILEGRRTQSGARHHDGRDLLVQVATLNAANGVLTGLVVNFSDISPLKSMERKRNELLNFVSHDLRSPLVSMSALLELAKGRNPDDTVRELLQRMEAYTGRTLNLAEQFLQLARAESSEGFVFRDVDMVSVALNAIEQVWGQAKTRNITLRERIDVDEAWLSGDGGLLERALINLLDNAIKYSGEHSCVTLNLVREDKLLRCCVEDEGPGIAAEEIPRLFDRFHRTPQTDNGSTRGAGLGLALVDVVAKRHGGRVDVQSTLGQGSCFCLLIPSEIKKPAGESPP